MHDPPSKRLLIICGTLIILSLIGARFFLVLTSPNGLYLDEGDSKKQVAHLIEHGTNTSGEKWPLMSMNESGGFTTAPYLYPLAVWSKVFGRGDSALRSFSQFITICAVSVFAYGAYLWKGKRFGYIYLLTGLALPWSWVSGNLAWDPVMVPFFLATGFLSFTLLAKEKVSSDFNCFILLTVLTLSMVLAAYSYPPARIAAPLLLLSALVYLIVIGKVSLMQIIASDFIGALAVIPLILFMLTPEGIARSAGLNVFRDGVVNGTGAYIMNMLTLMNPVHLFWSGDQNLRHSAGFQGMLGWAALVPVAYGTISSICHVRHHRAIPQIFYIAVVGIFAGLTGSALTHEAQPHYLRATAAWPFFALLLAQGWENILSLPRSKVMIALGAGGIATALFIVYLAALYPEASRYYF